MYLGIGIGILHLVKSKLISGNTKNTYILTKYANYITEIIHVQFNSHTRYGRSPDLSIFVMFCYISI